MIPEIKTTSPQDWKYISEGGSSIVFSYIGPPNDDFDDTVLRLRKIDHVEDPAIVSGGAVEDPDDPTIAFQHEVMQRLIPVQHLPRLESVRLDREWLEELKALAEEHRPLERREADMIDVNRGKGVLATNAIGDHGWAVEIKPKWGFLPSPHHLSLNTADIKTRTCRFCMHSHMKTTEGEDVALGYCPLDLYSGDKERVTKALCSLWDVWIGSSGAVNNWRVFVEGHMVKPSMLPSTLAPLAAQVLSSSTNAPSVDILRDAVIAKLLPLLLETPVLRTLSTLQRSLDALDIEGLSNLWTTAHTAPGVEVPPLGDGLNEPILEDWEAFLDVYLNKHALMDHIHPDSANLRYYCMAYLLSASFKDCSIILHISGLEERKPHRITVIDLDVKGVHRLHKWDKLDRKIVKSYANIKEPTLCVDGRMA